MTQTEISNLLRSGALFGGPSDKCLVFTGPMVAVDSTATRFDLAYKEFFGAELKAFKTDLPPVWVSRSELRAALSEYLALESPKSEPMKADDFTISHKSEYLAAFNNIKKRIQSGALKKAVPVVFARKNFRPGESLNWSQRAIWLLNILQAPQDRVFAYGFWNETEGCIGATPEVLFSLKERSLTTMALAGTLPKSEVKNRLLLAQDPKENLEHQLVIDDLTTQLRTLGMPVIGKTETLELPTLFHLRTKIDVQIAAHLDVESNVTRLVALLHPTPALGVSPRGAGHQWLADFPGQERRKFFGGPLIFQVSPDEVVALVAIRNVQWDQSGVQIGAGGGLVQDSEFEREWTELEQKRKAVFSSLGMGN